MTGTPVKVVSERQGCNAPLRIGVSHIGQPLCIAGEVFGRGFGGHADSDIRIVSDVPMQEFRAWAGFDDNPVVRSHSDLPRLTFSVEAGGKTLWSSPHMRLGDAAREAVVALDGVKEFHLRIRASSERAKFTGVEFYGQADWVDPEVLLTGGELVPLGNRGETPISQAKSVGRSSFEFSAADREIIRRLAAEVAEIAALPVQKRNMDEWKRLNGLRPGKPLVLVYLSESPMSELDADGETNLQTTDSFCRQIEGELRLRLFQWKHARGDMVVEPVFHVPYVFHDSGYGLTAQEDTVVSDPANAIVGHRYHTLIRNEEDVQKIQSPTLVCDWDLTEQNYQRARDLLGGVLSVEKRGLQGYELAPVDELFVWLGIEEGMACLVERPELFHMAMERLTVAHLHRLEQLKAMNLMTASFGGGRKTVSGGLAYTDELPRKGSDPLHPQTMDLWGGGMAQIFTAVSPDMHEEFALAYEKRVINQFGLAAYGCCEALHHKIHILKRNLPNLRKVSVTPWADVDAAVANIGDTLVFTHKPNPAMLAADRWDLEAVRKDFREFLAKTRGCIVEITLKDVSTMRYEPHRVFQWAQMAAEETARFAGC
jgi:hypothetical protein